MRLIVISVVVVGMLCCAGRSAAQETDALPGYGKYTTDVTMYEEGVALDNANFSSALSSNETSPPNYTEALRIFRNGQNIVRQRAESGKAPLISANEVLTTALKGLPTYELAVKYHGGNFIVSMIQNALTNSSTCCGVRTETAKAGMRAWPFLWSSSKIDEAYSEGLKSTRNAGTIRGLVDQAVALWLSGPFSSAERYAADTRYCTNSSSLADVNATSNAAFLAAAKGFRSAAIAGNAPDMNRYRAVLQKASTATLLQNMLYNLEEAATPPDGYVARAPPCMAECGGVVPGIQASKQAATLAYWQVIAPRLNATAPTETAAITSVLQKQKLNPQVVQTLLPLFDTATSKAGIVWDQRVDACAPPAEEGEVVFLG